MLMTLRYSLVNATRLSARTERLVQAGSIQPQILVLSQTHQTGLIILPTMKLFRNILHMNLILFYYYKKITNCAEREIPLEDCLYHDPLEFLVDEKLNS
jgi:hypothetical protein